MKSALVPLFFLFSAFLFAIEPIKWDDMKKNLDSWPEGPVSLLLTDDEEDLFKKLKTAEEKLQFIKIFWARRDPILRTRENEFKTDFYARVEHANKTFADANTPGWQTARGQVYLLFGRPQREEKRLVGDSSRPALLWVYDNIPVKDFPKNEALMFAYRDNKYVLLPPNPSSPGDTIGIQQRNFDSAFRYQTIPSVVQRAFNELAEIKIIDEKKNYDPLLFSVKTTEKFGLSNLLFDFRKTQDNPLRVEVVVSKENAPVYDDDRGNFFSELFFKQELMKDNRIVASNQHVTSLTWDPGTFQNAKDIRIALPELDSPSGSYQLVITMQDRISQVSASQKFDISIP